VKDFLLLGALAIAQTESVQKERYLGLAEATLREPITHEELRSAILSSAGVDSIRALFERAIRESLDASGTLVTPELGGEATLDEGKLTLIAYPDPVHPILREMAALRGDPARLLAFLESTPDGRDVLKTTGGLHALLYQMSSGTPTEAQRELFDRVTGSAIATHFKTWRTDPEIQARMIELTEWRGRYVGFWHIHPPRLGGDGFQSGIEPSLEDMRNAVELGQFLTIVFQPDGFDAYDLAPLSRLGATDLTKARVVGFRSPEWRRSFEERVRARRAGVISEEAPPGAPPAGSNPPRIRGRDEGRRSP
jgi:hypothetical protein